MVSILAMLTSVLSLKTTMHIAANRPDFVSDAEIPAEVIAKETEIQVVSNGRR